LNFDSFDQDRQAVIQRGRTAGVTRLLNPAIDLESSRAVLALAESTPEVYAAVGVHPNDADTWQDGAQDELRRLADHPKVVAIGEIGLDYYWERASHDLQQRIFWQQLELAAETGLPVVVHTRNASPTDTRATTDALDILEQWAIALAQAGSPLAVRPGVLHSFSDGVQAAQRARALHFCLGITGPVTYKKADLLREVVACLPLEALLIETDAPFLTPHPHRGERNEPAHVRFVAEKIAQVKALDYSTVAAATAQNAERLFLW
jgi:TatD DNase family protein